MEDRVEAESFLVGRHTLPDSRATAVGNRPRHRALDGYTERSPPPIGSAPPLPSVGRTSTALRLAAAGEASPGRGSPDEPQPRSFPFAAAACRRIGQGP